MALVHAIAKVSIAIYFHSLSSQIIFRLLKKADDFEAFALVRERRFPALVLQNVLGPQQCANIDFAHYDAITKCHFEGSKLFLQDSVIIDDDLYRLISDGSRQFY
jgi:hypothetical protein